MESVKTDFHWGKTFADRGKSAKLRKYYPAKISHYTVEDHWHSKSLILEKWPLTCVFPLPLLIMWLLFLSRRCTTTEALKSSYFSNMPPPTPCSQLPKPRSKKDVEHDTHQQILAARKRIFEGDESSVSKRLQFWCLLLLTCWGLSFFLQFLAALLAKDTIPNIYIYVYIKINI